MSGLALELDEHGIGIASTLAQRDLAGGAQHELFAPEHDLVFTGDAHGRAVRAVVDEQELAAAALDTRTLARGTAIRDHDVARGIAPQRDAPDGAVFEPGFAALMPQHEARGALRSEAGAEDGGVVRLLPQHLVDGDLAAPALHHPHTREIARPLPQCRRKLVDRVFRGDDLAHAREARDTRGVARRLREAHGF